MGKTILYTDGGCTGNEQRDCSKRNMVAVVSDDQAQILIDKHQGGGSNNIAELLAVKEAVPIENVIQRRMPLKSATFKKMKLRCG